MDPRPTYEDLQRRVETLEGERSRFIRMERDLKRNLRFTESLLAAIPTPVFFKDAQGRYLGCNPAFTELTGAASETILGKTAVELWPGDLAEVYHQKDLDLMREGTHQVYETEVRDRTGANRSVIFYKNVFTDENGRVAGLVGGFLDISDRKKAESELRAVFDMSLDMLCVADIRTATFIKVNPAFTAILGHSEADLLGQPFTAFIHPEDVEPTLEVIEKTLRSGRKVLNFRNRYRTRGGDYRWLRWVSHPVPEKGLTYAVAHDITEEIRSQEELRSQRDLLNSLFDNLQFGITVWDPEGRLLLVNKGFTEATGYTLEDVRSLDHWFRAAYPDPDYREQVIADWKSAKDAPDRVRVFKVTCRDGAVKDIEFRGAFLKDGRAVVTLADITDRRRAQEELEASHHLLRSILDAVPDLLCVVDRDYRILYSNDKGHDRIEKAAMTPGQACYDRYKRLEAPCHDCSAVPVFETGDSFQREMVNPADGRVREVRAFPILEADGGVSKVVEYVRDITELKAAQEENRRRKQFLESVLHHAPDAIVTLDPEHRVIDWNPGAVKLFGYSPEEAMGVHLDHLVSKGHYQKEAGEKTSKVLAGERVEAFETVRHRKDGTPRHVIATGSPILTNGVLEGAVAVYTDISDRVAAESALRGSEERFRTLVEQAPLGIALIGDDGRYRYINPEFQNMFGYDIEDIPTGAAWFRRAFPEKPYRRKVLREWMSDFRRTPVGQFPIRTFNVACRDGSRKEIQFRTVVMESRDHFIICEDITEKTKLERQFQQAQKFEAVGTLAGGIAHDFNNLLMGINGHASLMKVDLPDGHPHGSHLTAIEDHVRSATSLTRQLLGFARGGKYEVKPVDIGELVGESASLFARTKKEIRIHLKAPEQPLAADVDRGQIEQVLLNLYVNAWQAMPHGGDIFLETRTVQLDEDACSPYGLQPGTYVQVSITDTGIGMDAATRTRIFDPFFTTKEKGRGTGLGLASAYGIIKNHGGMITVYSEPSRGATFNLYLPLSEKLLEAEAPRERRLQKGDETLLLVDDEDMILTVGRAMLEKLGYRVLTAGGGREAVELVREAGGDIDLVILDMIMPGMDGGTTFDRIRELRPNMRVLLSSGYAINGQATRIMGRGCNGFIQKPFDMFALSEKLRSLLDR